MIYLDYNRTTPLAPSILEAMQPFWATHFMLPCQEHPHAQAVSEALEHAREGVALLLGCEPFEVVFTGSGTEANNLAILGLAAQHEPGHMLVSALEHDSVMWAAGSLAAQGWDIETVGCGPDGLLDENAIADRIRPTTKLACLQLANSILGTIQPVREVADLCHSRGVAVHCDVTQAVGKMPVDVGSLRVDMASISGHKLYGPKGSGAIFIRRGLHLAPITFGESREMGLRPGSENVPACVGLGAAASLSSRCCSDAANTLNELRDRLVAGLQSVLPVGMVVLCEDSPRLPNTIAVEMPVDAKRIQQSARQLVLATAQSDTPPDEMTRALRAIGRTNSQIGRTVRLSLGWTTSREQIDRAVDMLAEATDGLLR